MMVEKTPQNLLNIAAVTSATRALGPGVRSALWVQGCPFRCPGCIAPEWVLDEPARLATPEELVDELLADPSVTGITFSGGEPMLQAAGLAEVVRLARQVRDVDVICFSGYQLEDLRSQPPNHAVSTFLSQIDVLIDGPYIAALNDNQGLRGSSNQRIHYLTPRLITYFLEEAPRRAEINIKDGQAFLVGVPPKGMGQAFSVAMHEVQSNRYRLLEHERA
jgi:anaerobic ribonucleoside-triphosphate reductase activating protein